MTDGSPSQDTLYTPSFLTIPDYNGLEQGTNDYNTLETNLNVSTLLLSKDKFYEKFIIQL